MAVVQCSTNGAAGKAATMLDSNNGILTSYQRGGCAVSGPLTDAGINKKEED
jgi:hypothetical protein